MSIVNQLLLCSLLLHSKTKTKGERVPTWNMLPKSNGKTMKPTPVEQRITTETEWEVISDGKNNPEGPLD